jgi:hypothetical protein
LDTLEEIENIKTFFFFVRIFLPISSQVCLGLERIKKGLEKSRATFVVFINGEVILALPVHNNSTHTRHIEVRPT